MTRLLLAGSSVLILVQTAWAFVPKVSVDTRRHIHYGNGSAVFPIVIYDFNSNLCDNPANELQLLSQLSIDTVIDVVCDSASSAIGIANALMPYGFHLWSTVPGGVGYTGNDPGFVNELRNLQNVTGYFITDEPQSDGDLVLTNNLVDMVKAVDPSALQVTSFNDATWGGSFPSYGGGQFPSYLGNEMTIDVLGNSWWNNTPPRSTNGLYDVTLESNVWDGFANSIFPALPLFHDIAFYGPAALASCYLTRQQTFSEAWTAVIEDASGLAWWALGVGETAGGPMCDGSNETYAQLWADLVFETRQISAVAPVILGPVSTWYTHVQPETVVQTTGRDQWIFAANLTQNRVSDTFRGIPAGSAVVAYAGNSDGSNRTVCTNCGTSFSDRIPGFVAYGYKITPRCYIYAGREPVNANQTASGTPMLPPVPEPGCRPNF